MKITTDTLKLVDAGTFFDFTTLLRLMDSGLYDFLEKQMLLFKKVRDAVLMKKYGIKTRNFCYSDYAFSDFGNHAYGEMLKTLAKNIIAELNRVNEYEAFMFAPIPSDNDIVNVQFVTDFIWYYNGYKNFGYLK